MGEKTTIEDEEIGARAAEIEDDPDLAPTTTDRSVTRVLCTVRIGLDKVSNSTVCPTECHLRRDILSSRVTADSTVTGRMVICTLLRDTTIQCLLVDTSHLHSHLVQCPLRVLVESPPPSLPCNTFPKSTRTAIFNDFSLPLVKLKRHVSQALRTTADCRQAWSYTKIQSQHVLH